MLKSSRHGRSRSNVNRLLLGSLPLLLALTACSAAAEGAGVTICAGPGEQTAGDAASIGRGQMAARIVNESRSDLVLTEVTADSGANIAAVEYTIQDGEEHHDVEGYVIPAGGSAMLALDFTGADPSRDASLEGISVVGKAGWSTTTIPVIDTAMITPKRCSL